MAGRRGAGVVAVALAAASLLSFASEGTAQTKQALVNISYKSQFFPGGTTLGSRAGTGLASVQTGVASPSLMWPAGLVSGATSYAYSGPGLSGTRVETFMDLGATWVPNHPLQAPAAGSSVMASTNIPITNTVQIMTPPSAPTTTFTIPYVATTKCFKTIASGPAAPAPGRCANRFGQIGRIPGAKKYGGTARLLVNGSSRGKTGFHQFDIHDFDTPNYSALQSAPGRYAQVGTGRYTHTVTGGTLQTNRHATTAPLTTGTVTAMQPFGTYVTNLTGMGVNSFTTASLCPGAPGCGSPGFAYTPVGTLSLVRPSIVQSFGQIDGSYAGTFTGIAGIQTVSVTFMPEPGVLLSLTLGALALAGLVRSRKAARLDIPSTD